jgi:nucleoside-diphosphate-sugar epimerase
LMRTMSIDTEEQLEDRLSHPSAADVEAMRVLQGDVIVLGAAGKMGPSLVRRMQRASVQSGVKRRIIAVARFSERTLPAQLEASGIETIATDLLEDDALNASKQHRLFGYPTVTAREMIDWVAHWIEDGNRLLGKPTHFQARDGKF